MSSLTPSRQAPNVEHNFEGDVQVLNATFESRNAVRKSLATLQQDLQKMGSGPAQIQAEIRLRVGGKDAKEHLYSVTVNSTDFNVDQFTPQASQSGGKATSGIPGPANGQQATPSQSTSRPESHDDDVVEIRPFKRARTDRESTSSELPLDGANDSPFKERAGQGQSQSSKQDGEVLSFIREWHTEWVRQGGWLFDNITKMSTSTLNNKVALDKKLDSVQDVLGQSLNSASGNTLNELGNISKLIPWLEHCRKTNADKVQAREEKWRSSSATFHDQTRREREAAEKRIEKKLEEQRELLLKLARVNGIDSDEKDAIDVGSPGGSDKSLGAQLTAELNMEAERGNSSKSSTGRQTIQIDDD